MITVDQMSSMTIHQLRRYAAEARGYAESDLDDAIRADYRRDHSTLSAAIQERESWRTMSTMQVLEEDRAERADRECDRMREEELRPEAATPNREGSE